MSIRSTLSFKDRNEACVPGVELLKADYTYFRSETGSRD